MTLVWVGMTLAGCGRRPPVVPALPDTALDRRQAQMIEERRAVVLSQPGSGVAWGELGQALDAVEYDEEAGRCYEEAARLEPEAAKWFHLLGLVQLQNEPERAIASLARAAELTGNRPDASRLRLAQALIERGREEEAEPHLQQLLALDRYHAGARLEMARIHLLRNSLSPAAEALLPCLTNAHTARPALLLLAQVRQRQGNRAEAAEIAARAAGMPRQFDWPDPFLREVYRLRTDRIQLQDKANGLLVAGQTGEAEQALGELLQAYPGDADALLLLGRLRFQQRDCRAAETVLRAHLAARPESLNGLIQLSLAILCQERWEDGAAVLRQAIKIKPDFAKAHYNLGYALSRAGDGAGAIGSFSEALRCSPGDVTTLVALADEYFRSGQSVEAERHLARALALSPEHPKARQLREQHPKP